MDLSTITVADFKARFYRDFQYQTVRDQAINNVFDPDFVQDRDIEIAFEESKPLFNQGLFGDDSAIRSAYLYLTAHTLCCNINAANAGINNPSSMPVTGRSVGSVSESYLIPDAYKENPILAAYTQTSYGLKYLAAALPGMTGNVVTVLGWTHP